MLTEQADDGIEQHGGAYRLDQHPIKAGSVGLAKDLLPSVAGHHDPVGTLAHAAGDEAATGLDAIQPRHVPVQQYHFVGLSLLLGAGDHLQCLLARFGGVHHKAHAAQRAAMMVRALALSSATSMRRPRRSRLGR